MQVVFHMGAHCTDEDRLIRSLLKSRGALAPHGIVVPAPGRYRTLLRQAMTALKGEPASAEAQEVMLDAMIDDDHAERLVLSSEFFLGILMRVVSDQGLYAAAAARFSGLASLFPDAECEFHMALRNPATLIPALLGRIPSASYDSLMGDSDPVGLRWLPVVRGILEGNPGIRLVLWCNEDTPLIWPDILRRMCGIGYDVALEGDEDLLAQIMTEDGLARLADFLARRPPTTPEQRRQIVSAFLDKYGIEGEIDMEVPLPGWTDATVERITTLYEADIAAIAHLPGVEFLWP